jgi:hypothetical protein
MTFYEFYDFLYPPGENDFKLEKFLSGTPETFEPFYGNYSISITNGPIP